jgi:hypothetical protein
MAMDAVDLPLVVMWTGRVGIKVFLSVSSFGRGLK